MSAIDKPRILFFDLETRPAQVSVFSLWKPIIGMDQIIEPSRVIAWSAQWHGTKKTLFGSEFHDESREVMLQRFADLWNEADVVVTFNGARFDIPWISDQMIQAKMPPLKPVRHIDLYRIAKQKMRLLSGKLDYLSLTLLDDRKVKHEGFGLWVKCMAGDPAAWARMKKYAMKDTALMLPIYDILLPYMKAPNLSLYGGNSEGCPTCGSDKVQKRGFYYTEVSKYQQYACQACGAWFKAKHAIETVDYRNV